FIRSLESRLDWPVQVTAEHLEQRAARDRRFDAEVQRWLGEQDRPYLRNDPVEWRAALVNMARTLAYVWANRIIFYKALRTRFGDLPRLELRPSIATDRDAAEVFAAFFRRAVERSGDYEPLLFPEAKDWASDLVFQAPHAIQAWRSLLRGIDAIDFKDVPSDVVGRIFQKLISPEERRRFGQHFTGDDAVDLINAFCVHGGADRVLDPACGSGSFLVRAYYRKQALNPARSHQELLSELFGCDIALYPAHLATLNLAAREIRDEANYPRIARRDFFDFDPREKPKAFCSIPDGRGGTVAIHLPLLDAVVGNPPYVRQEKVAAKERYQAVASGLWNGFELSGRADLHCFFWPVAAKMLKPGGYFGFLTSSSWLDVEYGFALQGWILKYFKILAVMESAAEPWFTDARVKTVITILQRCDDEAERMDHVARFVRFDRPLTDLIGAPPTEGGKPRQRAVERLRDRILRAKGGDDIAGARVILRQQRDLWDEGVKTASIARAAPAESTETADDEEIDDPADVEPAARKPGATAKGGGGSADYVAAKWGRYVRAPRFYFEMMERFRHLLVPLGDLVTIRRGITSGCDAFFMPTDVTEKELRERATEQEFRQRWGVSRASARAGKHRLLLLGDNSAHPIEAEYVAPEVHSLMKIDRPVVRADDLDRVVLLIDKPLKALQGTWAYKLLKYGETQPFLSKKSKSVPVAQRSTCAARKPWYDLTKLVKPGFAFWPMSQQYRHIIAANPEHLICNHNLFDLSANALTPRESDALWAVLNSTFIGLFKTFYGRYAGTEGNLKTEVIDVNLIDVPDVRGVTAKLARRLSLSMKSMCARPIGRLVEEQLMECRSLDRARRLAARPLVLADELRQDDRRELDDAVFELLGVAGAAQRASLVAELHAETARHFREIRVVEIEKMEQRGRTAARKFSASEMAADAWDAAALADAQPLAEWLARHPACSATVSLPDERPASLSPSPMFDANVAYFGRGREHQMACRSPVQAALIVRLTNLGLAGVVHVPNDDSAGRRVHDEVDSRVAAARAKFNELAAARTSEPGLQEAISNQLLVWFIAGRGLSEREC
ncbi:MAG: SAM-dependent DNA methyltransferase, partial [Planctomycetes bacterium]|nr:SAM-dependent DNA methyltransferase [Planctomycetota bacterium]